MGTNKDTTGSSYLYDYGTTPNTRVAVSQKVRLRAPMYGQKEARQMGVVSSFAPSISRSVEPVRGIGYGDKVAELVPGVTDPETASFERALLYLCNLWQSTGYAGGVDGPVRSLRHHRWPFDIEQQLVFSSLVDWDFDVANRGQPTGWGDQDQPVKEGNVSVDLDGQPKTLGHSATITIYEACWFNSWSTTYSQDTGTIMESGDVTITDVHDAGTNYGEFIATGNDPTIQQLGSSRFSGPSGEKVAAPSGLSIGS